MYVRILGAAAGGGLPQWNCRCPNCISVRKGTPGIRARSQSSLAISPDGQRWYLLNVSPDIRQQIADFPALNGSGTDPRGTAIAGAILTDAEIDHTTGLLLLREGTPFPVFSTGIVHDWLTRFYPIEPILSSFFPRTWEHMTLGTPLVLPCGTIEIIAFPLDAHPPRFVADVPKDLAGSVIGLHIRDKQTGGAMVYAPGVARITPDLAAAVEGATAILMDGTFWTEDEMIQRGLSDRYAADMGHIPVSGDNGSLAWLSGLQIPKKIYVHINNTNPMLNEHGPEHEQVVRAGIHIGADGDALEL